MKKALKKKLFFFFIQIAIGIFFFSFSSCHCKKNASSHTLVPAETGSDFEKDGYIKAIVIKYEVDGCAFLLKLMDEKKLEPTNLSIEFKKDQFAVWIKYVPKKGVLGICMAGQTVELLDIQIRK